MSAWVHAWLVAWLAVGCVGCDPKVPPRDTLRGWPPGEPLVVGSCALLLHQASLWHSTEWHLEVEVSAENTGSEAVYCGASAQALTGSDAPLTDAGKGGGETKPGESRRMKILAREADVTGMSTGAAEGAWVYVELSQGRWPSATTQGVRVDPERVRPPS